MRYLDGSRELDQASIAQRMSWAANRETTRIEDVAYSLLGIFNINMPLLYGESYKAFLRLQEEILKRSMDQSILVWERPREYVRSSTRSVLAKSPRWFPRVDEQKERYQLFRRPYAITNNGLEMRTKLGKIIYGPELQHESLYWLTLNYSKSAEPECILLVKIEEPNVYERSFVSDKRLHDYDCEIMEEQLVYLRTGPEVVDYEIQNQARKDDFFKQTRELEDKRAVANQDLSGAGIGDTTSVLPLVSIEDCISFYQNAG